MDTLAIKAPQLTSYIKGLFLNPKLENSTRIAFLLDIWQEKFKKSNAIHVACSLDCLARCELNPEEVNSLPFKKLFGILITKLLSSITMQDQTLGFWASANILMSLSTIGGSITMLNKNFNIGKNFGMVVTCLAAHSLYLLNNKKNLEELKVETIISYLHAFRVLQIDLSFEIKINISFINFIEKLIFRYKSDNTKNKSKTGL